MELNSRDFIYSFTIPAAGIREVAVPGIPMSAEFTTGQPATFELLGDQFCGFSHENLIGTVIVENDARFSEWLTSVETEPALTLRDFSN